ncbi:BglG family transcription antiterminator [Breznakia pachnodae]|uniref:Lichenan operon transcriptional antiterminator n=1 Tax=Breznakia pachnodae TaxID=265178 RepID=A0ABU0E0B9_9FIRM|nr:transcription antiterminator [Breznakia pachnodae]MDQ0360266.1 lichenan operon transcriptional antiterminator [Breznakia pachnodae]
MKRREKEIIYYLVKNNQYVTGNELADHFGVTSRTIRDDVNAIKQSINESIAFINSQAGKGYLLEIRNYKMFEEFLNDLKLKDVSQYHNIPDNPNDRVSYIIKKLLMLNFSIKIDDLAEELYVSRSTLTSEIKQVRKKLEKYDLKLSHQTGKGLIIEGEEIKKRLCISEYYFHNSADDGYFAEDSILFASSVNQEEISLIKKLLLDTLNQYHIFMSDVSFQNLVIHLIVSIRRMRYSYYVEYDKEKIELFQQLEEYQVAKTIADVLGKEFNEIWNASEICYLASHILAKKMILHDDGEKKVSKRVHFMIEKIIFEIYMKTGIDLGNDEYFKNVLKLHLNPLILRLQSGLISRNMMLEDIKMNYPFAYELALLAKNVIEDEMKVSVIEDECGYIALYIGLSIEKMIGSIPKKNILLVSSLGRSSIEIQKFKIMNQFDDYISSLDVVELYEFPNINHDTYDLILSSVPITYKANVPILYVNSILSRNDLDHIKEKLSTKFNDVKKEELYSDIKVADKRVNLWSEINEVVGKMQMDENQKKDIQHAMKSSKNMKLFVQNGVAVAFTLYNQSSDFIFCVNATDQLISEKKVFHLLIFIGHSLNELAQFQQSLQYLHLLISNKEQTKRLLELNAKEYKNELQTYLNH